MRITMLAFAGGVAVLHLLPVLPPAGVLLPIGLLAAGLVRRCRPVAAALAGFVLSAFAAGAALEDRWPVARHGEVLPVTGTVSSLPAGSGIGAHFMFHPDAGQDADLPHRIRVGWYLESPPPSAATRWRFVLRMRAPRGGVNPAAFDYERWLTARRIGATASVLDLPPPQRLTGANPSRLLSVRVRVDATLDTALGEHPRRAIVRGLALGERGEIDAHEWEVFARTGTAHLMAISGLHVGMVSALVYGLARVSLRRVPVLADRSRQVAVVAGLLAAAAYAALAGFSVPTRRALVMLVAAAVQILARRDGVAYFAWSGALVVVSVTDPLSHLTIGFWLSFGAVAFIAWQVSGRRRQPGALVQLARAQWAVAVGLLPLTLWFFQRGSFAAPLANLVAVPAFTLLIVPSILVGTLLSLVAPDAGAWWFELVLVVLDVAWNALETVAAWPWAQRFTPRPPPWTILMALAGAAILLAPRGLVGRMIIGVALCAPMLAWRPAPPEPGAWRMTLLDVGQGLAAVVRTHTHTLVYDAGPSYGPDADAGARIVVPFLRAHGIVRVDTLIVSHPHDDHQGGIASLRSSLPVGRVLAGAPNTLRAGAVRCRAGQVWYWDDVIFRILHPVEESAPEPNLVSCVVDVRGRSGSALLPGDIEWPVELELARPGGELRQVDAMVVPHHGSATSSTPRFVATTAPAWALVPAGYANRWNLPDEDVIELWEATGAEVFVTGVDGAVTVDAGPETGVSQVIAERQRQRRWWRSD